MTSILAGALLASVVCLSAAPVASAQTDVSFGRDVRPILSNNCFFCHGPDEAERQADLRLDTREGLFASLGNVRTIVPGDAEQSELYQRLITEDQDDRMPPKDSGHELTKKQIATLGTWIQQGAKWEGHWSFAPVHRSHPPASTKRKHAEWAHNPIDQFVLARLEAAGLSPSEEADRHTLIRRLSLDLTGLPPTIAQVDTFVSDDQPGAYERLVDQLLASEHYGERMALSWMDAARYADSAGYQSDFKRSQWPWRDWVIQAYNANMPFDQFTIQQLAGDLLPGATDQQRLATAFNRNHRINNEGGIIPEEYLVEYVADRVETTSTVWLGLTMGCVRCHDHKYDPLLQTDYYSLFAFFHNVPEKGKDGQLAPVPNMSVYTTGSKVEHETLKSELDTLLAQKKTHVKTAAREVTAWVKAESARLRKVHAGVRIPNPASHYTFDENRRNTVASLVLKRAPGQLVKRGKAARIVPTGRQSGAAYVTTGGYFKLDAKLSTPFATPGIAVNAPMAWSFWVKPGKDIGNVEGPILAAVTPDKKHQGYQINLIATAESNSPYRVAFRLYKDVTTGDGIEVVTTAALIKPNIYNHITVSHSGSLTAAGVTITVDGKTQPTEIVRDNLSANFFLYEDLLFGALTEDTMRTNIRDHELRNSYLDELIVFRADLSEPQRKALHELTSLDVILLQRKHTKPQRDYIEATYYRDRDPAYQKLLKQVTSQEAKLARYATQNVTEVSIMEEMPKPRDTYVLVRGAYNNPDKSRTLAPTTPTALPAMADGLPNNRLGLAEWIVSDDNPLTPRVAVNRYWQMYFGSGLVRTPGDFGAQGTPPTHPALLDWLASEFRDTGWDIKALQKLIVTSATYRQRSAVDADLLQRDPENRLLARGPRFRLNGQALRDQALAASGLLVTTIGGPSVMPYQPEGLWEEVSAKGYKYVVAKGDDLYRRSLYTFWRRTVPPPSMMNFDNAGREVCTVSVARTNTPLQAMNLLNDPTFVETARVLAQRMINEGGEKIDGRLNFGYRLVLARPLSAEVRNILTRGYQDYEAAFLANLGAAEELISFGQSRPDPDLDPVQLAAHTMVASVILNLDEAVTKE
ncbi:MAG: PSD1 and planctomycete cytochrome C domain-containing protein [Fuerstiella sp.]